MPRRWMFRLSVMVSALILLFALVIFTGSAELGFREVLRSLGGLSGTSTAGRIVAYSRLPRAITALLGGAALAVAGLGMQTLLGNPLAGPFVLGINAAATAGVAVAGLVLPALAVTPLVSTTAASLGAAFALVLLLILAARVGSILKLTIFGVLLGYGFAAVVTLALQFAAPRELSAFVGWTFGSFGRTDYREIVILLATTAVGTLIALLNGKSLDALYLGPEEASTLGVSLRRLRLSTFFSAAILVGGVTAFCGPLAFIGVVAPHLGRWIGGTSRHRVLLAFCLVIGGAAALLAELIASMPGTAGRLPLNAVLSLLGIPVIGAVLLGLGGDQP